ncbi:hypothetical protein SESBI_37862 [Sesbania bispinosa]|nr:hypothetical protein SESBI_37862 [Sesbania bispinosa]
MVEDQDNTSNAPKAKKSIRITTTDSNLERLVEITKLMSKEMRGAFNKMYGRILDLLDISVKTPVISALAQFWSSDLHCFELPNLDLVPTIEEYMRITRLPIDDNIRGLRKSFLEDHLEALAGRGSWHYFNKTLALTIYGLILFPFAPNMVDHAAMDVFAQYKTQGLNPVPAILADTLLTLELRTLFPDPLRDFGRIQVKRREAREWKKELADIQDNMIAWTCPWYSPYEVIFSCGDFANVPLMGPRGCVAYTPSIALRQLKRTQFKPMEEQLGGIQYDVPDASQLLDREYHEWRKARGVLEYILREAPHGEGSSRSSDEVLKAMASELERARAQIK